MKCYLLDLPKDCGCITHDGPHWLHMDRVKFQMDLDILKRGGRLAFHAFAVEEAMRLADKRLELQRLVKREDAPIVLPDGYRESDYNEALKQL